MSIIGHAGHAEGADGHLAAAEPDAVDDDSGFPLWTNHLLTRSAENWAAHTHDVHELLWGTRGTLTAQTDDGFFAVPDLVGVWIPAGVVHRVSSAPGTGFYCTYIATPVPEHLQRETLTVTVPRAARELMLHLREQQMPMSARRRASAVVVDLLAPARLGPLTVPMPADPRLIRITDALLAAPSDARTLQAWARETNSSVRHLARLFELETGMGFAQWRTLARMRAAVTLLAAGHPVNAVARRVGYRTSSAFVQAFAKVMGRTPGVYLDPGP
jgi:AraC-like DNA-binding protein